MEPVDASRKCVATWRLVTSFDQEKPKLGYSICGLPCAITDTCQDRVPQRFGVLGRPAPARRRFVVLGRPVTPSTFAFVPSGEIRSPHDKLAVPEKKQQGIIVRTIRNTHATYVRRMIRQAASDRKYPFQKFRRSPPLVRQAIALSPLP
jgi:hypothetical protein